ncbi:MAG TPA: TIGR03087 family PEP-CTERM/XrtA system glycosyltransferase, partial [Vicinamibacteria bacterium]
RFLSERYRVHLGTFVDHDDDWRYLPELRKLCADVCAVKLNPRRQRLFSLKGLLSGDSLSVPYYQSSILKAWVGRKVYEEGITRMVFFSTPMAQYAPSNGAPFGKVGKAGKVGKVRKVVDFVDVDSEKWRQYSERHTWPLGWLYRREGQRLLEFEREVAFASDASVFVTPEEADLFRRRAGFEDARLTAVINGVDSEYFDPARSYENPYTPGKPVLVFTGMMDYWANVDAVTWFASDCFPSVGSEIEGLRFVIVGARPTRQVERLASRRGVEVTGSVADVRPYLAHADVAVAPLRVARGIQNKVLEAMAMAKPVVTTGAAREGLNLTAEICRGGDSAEDFAGAVLALLRSPQECGKVGTAGRAWVRENHEWARTLRPVVDLIENGSMHGRA